MRYAHVDLPSSQAHAMHGCYQTTTTNMRPKKRIRPSFNGWIKRLNKGWSQHRT
jgi:hypothetical protein